jgi:hypothetical protein
MEKLVELSLLLILSLLGDLGFNILALLSKLLLAEWLVVIIELLKRLVEDLLRLWRLLLPSLFCDIVGRGSLLVYWQNRLNHLWILKWIHIYKWIHRVVVELGILSIEIFVEVLNALRELLA